MRQRRRLSNNQVDNGHTQYNLRHNLLHNGRHTIPPRPIRHNSSTTRNHTKFRERRRIQQSSLTLNTSVNQSQSTTVNRHLMTSRHRPLIIKKGRRSIQPPRGIKRINQNELSHRPILRPMPLRRPRSHPPRQPLTRSNTARVRLIPIHPTNGNTSHLGSSSKTLLVVGPTSRNSIRNFLSNLRTRIQQTHLTL